MAAVADYLIDQKGATIVLVPHVLGPGEDRDDRVMAQRIWSLLKHGQGARVVMGEYGPEELKGLIGRFELFLGLRMHANIAALSMCVPTIALAYSRKTHGIMNMLNQEAWVLDYHALQVDALKSRIEELWAQRKSVRADLRDRINVIKQRARENVELVGQVLEERNHAHTHNTGRGL